MAFNAALELVLGAWISGAAVLLAVYLSISLANSRRIVFAALTASVHATWMVPAILLIALRSPMTGAAGILLIAAAAFFLCSAPVPRNATVTAPDSLRQPRTYLFSPLRAAHSGGAAWYIVGAVLIQAGILAWWFARHLLAAVLVASGVCVLTRLALSRGAARRRKPSSAGRAALVLAVTTLLSAFLLATLGGGTAGNQDFPARTITRQLVNPPSQTAAEKQFSVTNLFKAKADGVKVVPDGVTGVVLRPKTAPKPARLAPSLFTVPRGVTGPVTFPFTGEYFLYPVSSGGIPGDALVQIGAPIEGAYKTFGGSRVETEAYQTIRPPYDFSCCERLRVTYNTGEEAPGTVTTDLLVGGEWIPLGAGFFGVGTGERSGEETADFEIPVRAPRILEATAIRVRFFRNATLPNQTVKAAVIRFELVPRRRQLYIEKLH